MIIQNKGDYTYHIGVRLIPGTNKLEESDKEAFNTAKKLPLNKHLIETGVIVLPDGEKVEDSIRDVTPPSRATKLIKDTFDLDLLEQFLAEEQDAEKPRESVVKAITDQIDSIKAPPNDDENS